jgi:four helix bundle protein
MNAEELQDRTFKFSVALIEFVKTLPQYGAMGEVTRQLLDAGTSVAANYRASCRARSRAEFNAKMGVVAEEADETVLWLQLLVQSKTAEGPEAATLLEEARELRAIMAASAKTARNNYRTNRSNQQIHKSINQSTNRKIKK